MLRSCACCSSRMDCGGRARVTCEAIGDAETWATQRHLRLHRVSNTGCPRLLRRLQLEAAAQARGKGWRARGGACLPQGRRAAPPSIAPHGCAVSCGEDALACSMARPCMGLGCRQVRALSRQAQSPRPRPAARLGSAAELGLLGPAVQVPNHDRSCWHHSRPVQECDPEGLLGCGPFRHESHTGHPLSMVPDRKADPALWEEPPHWLAVGCRSRQAVAPDLGSC